MNEEKTSAFLEIRKKIRKSISRSLSGFLKSDRVGVEEAIALLASDSTIQPYSIRTIRNFYEAGEEQKKIFFTILASLEARKVDYILNQIYAAMDTPEWLIQLRDDLYKLVKKLAALKPQPSELKGLKDLPGVFTDYFKRIFNFQYLVTRFCDTQNTSISLLKFISEKEGVHPTEHWWSFENRLNSPDHIILSVEHFKMPYVPLVYVEVAFSKGLIRKIYRIIGERRQTTTLREADTAIFYSLNSTFAGLRGIGIGAKMIIRAREYLEKNYPQIKRFSTLSPIPGFGQYLFTVLDGTGQGFSLTAGKIDINKRGRFFTSAEIENIKAELGMTRGSARDVSNSEMLKAVLKQKEWHKNPVFKKALKHPLTELTRYYLEREKKVDRKNSVRTTDAYDPVANFHLSNGAYIGSVNYLANRSERGMRESFGMMLNYIYDGRRLEENKLLYSTGKVLVKC